ncbi:interferon-induced GTP-binding protein Mx-like isoform X2 [Haliotis asinina]|uniref:interferon-induced GTP-binding protein Mx-like isoform X2 n=1 Tax=Haliotis asinina TaxID=109174 RepID=UPI0035324C7F
MASHKTKDRRGSPATPPTDGKRVKTSHSPKEKRKSFASSFDAEVRPLIDLVDKLRGYGLDRDINLPAVAVIGDQSAGKSSVLEAISGVQLPRGSGTVTRCPLEMRMKHSADEDTWEGKIMYKDKHDVSHEEVILNRESVGDFVRKAQDGMTDCDMGISDELITLEVTSSDVPDLTVIDLPGIARNAVEGQPDDIEARIKDMIRKYIKRQETIILAVLQCNVDIATCEALKMAKEFDKEGRRTLGVLTKPDLLDRGAETSVMRILNNVDFTLSKGYIIVKCRGQEAVSAGQSLTEALANEDSFFKTHSHFRSLNQLQWGIPALSVRLSLELQKHIKKLVPEMKEDVRRKLLNTDQELQDLGEDPPQSISDKRKVAHRMVHEFITIATAMTTGERIYDQRFPQEINNLYSTARQAFENLYRKCVAKQPDIKDKKLKSDLKQKIRASRGREFCNFMGKFELVESCAREYISKVEEPALHCFDIVHETTTGDLITLAEVWFEKFPDFAEKDAITTTRKETQNECRSEIRGYFSMEKLVYSQDETYSRELRNHNVVWNAMDCPGTEESGELDEAAEEGEYIARPLLQRSVIPEDVNGVNKALMSLKSYCQVASRRLCDVIPMIIQQHVFQKKVKTLQELLIGMVSEEGNIDLIKEEEDMELKRKEIKYRYDRLLKAERELEQI